MKIAVWHNLPGGGGKRALHYHVQGLLQRGHQIEAWCPPTADQTYLPLQELIREHVIPMKWENSPVSEKSLAKKASWILRTLSRNIRELDNHCRQCAEDINRANFDILFANSSLFMSVAPIARYVNIPKIIYLQEPSRPLYEVYEAGQKWPWIPPVLPPDFWRSPGALVKYVEELARIRYHGILAREEWTNISVYDAVLVNSYFSRESISRAYGVNARVCYLSVDANLFNHRNQRRDDFVVGIGSIMSLKNIEFVIKALAHVSGSRPRLIWIGHLANTDYLNRLKGLATAHHVVFEPRHAVSDEAVIDILNRAAMMVYAPRLEPFGFAPLEANACGLPVVAVAEGGIRETVIDEVNGLLVEPDEKAMARAIERLRDNRELASSLGQTGRQIVVDKWSMSSGIDRIERRLDEVIRSRTDSKFS